MYRETGRHTWVLTACYPAWPSGGIETKKAGRYSKKKLTSPTPALRPREKPRRTYGSLKRQTPCSYVCTQVTHQVTRSLHCLKRVERRMYNVFFDQGRCLASPQSRQVVEFGKRRKGCSFFWGVFYSGSKLSGNMRALKRVEVLAGQLLSGSHMPVGGGSLISSSGSIHHPWRDNKKASLFRFGSFGTYLSGQATSPCLAAPYPSLIAVSMFTGLVEEIGGMTTPLPPSCARRANPGRG